MYNDEEKKIKTWKKLNDGQRLLSKWSLGYLDKEFGNDSIYWIKFSDKGYIYLNQKSYETNDIPDANIYLDRYLNIILKFKDNIREYIIVSNEEIISGELGDSIQALSLIFDDD